MAGSSDDLALLVTEWLHTVAVDGHTVRDCARRSIVPGEPQASDGARAMSVLERLAQESGGTTSARIEVEHTIGEGGMGVVRLATQVTLGRKVAVKTLRPQLRSDQATMHLLREAWVTGWLEHPNVVPVYDIALDPDGAPIIVLKRIEGVQWSQLLADADAVRDRFSADDLLDWNLGILLQVVNAIRFAHTRGIIHRDIKPDNVMIGEFGEVYLLDWGIAVSLRDDDSGRLPVASEATEMAGTLCYMAPEMLGGGTLTERTDVYLLGATLYELLTGHPPHAGDSAMQIVNSITAETAPDPDGAPPALASICRRAMDPDPDGRFERVEQLRLAIQGYRQHRGAERLVERADQRGAELLAALRGPDDDRPEHRQRLYKLFGESRFGYREALAQWSQSERARAGLHEVTRAMANHEMAHGDARAAANLLSELDDASDELRAQLAQARAAEEVERVRIAELEALERQHDLRMGTRTRFFLAIVLGTLWTGLPLVEYSMALAPVSNAFMIAFTVTFLGVAIALGLWARETLSKTAINRALAAAVVLMFVGQLLMFVGAWLMDMDPVVSQVLMIGLWSLPAAMATYTVDRRLWPMTIGYAVAFLVASRWPDQRLPVMAACNFVLMVNGVVVWWPRRTMYPDGILSRR